MKKMLITNTFRSIKNTFSRFAAIFAIIALGSGFYAGIKAAGPDMKASAWDNYNKSKLGDVHILSTLGIEEKDVAAIEENEYTEYAEAAYSSELFINSAKLEKKIVKVYSYNENSRFNHLEIQEGRLPENENECVVDYNFTSSETPMIGDKIWFAADSDTEIEDVLKKTEYTVVGLVRSPMYISFERGTASIGDGVMNGYVYLPEENFSYDVYTDMYVKVKDSEQYDPFKSEYDELIDKAMDSYEETAEIRVDARVQEITDEAYEEINDAKSEIEDGKKEIADAEKEIKDARSEIAEAKEKLTDAEIEYHDGERAVETLKSKSAYIYEIIDKYSDSGTQENVDEEIIILNQSDFFAVDETLVQLLTGYILMPAAFDNGTKAMSKQGLEIYSEELVKNADELEKELVTARQEIDDGYAEIADAENEIADAEKDIAEAEIEIADGEKEIADAEADLAEIVDNAEWYVFNREDYYPSYGNYGEDCDRIDAIASVFPLFFILIAALVCWTTMTRMVEEQRIQIGTLKALGYSRFDIMSQDIAYAVAASVPGSIFGLIVGFKLLPTVIYTCYKSMYAFDGIETPFLWNYGIGCTIVACLCTGLSSLYSCRKELRTRPAQLMRAKPPKNGKRIFMERIGFIWNKLKFSHKVTFRNLFRYKSRVMMTIVGIGGCTALLLTAFGLRNAIASIVDRQFGGIFLYDAITAVDEDEADYEAIISAAEATGDVNESMCALQKVSDVYGMDDKKMEVYLVVPEQPEEIGRYIDFREVKSGEKLELTDDGVLINEKLAKLIGVKKGDSIYFNKGSKLKVAGIFENYTYNYVYMTTELYKEAGFDNEALSNIIYMNMTDVSKENELSQVLVERDDVLAVSYSSSGGDKFRDLINSLTAIVVVVIGAAGALAFVVMFNLANININERVHELATIKVLGFYDGEVASYIYRENTISAILGMVVGLFAGIFLEAFVIQAAEVDIVMFAHDIPLHCFAAAAGMTILFTVIVNIFLFFRLKKIDMAASLKAIE